MYLELASFIFISVLMYCLLSKKQSNLTGHHCLVTGGSSGIGLAIAVQASKLGANVTLVARSQNRLIKAAEVVKSERADPLQKVLIFSADLSLSSSDLKDLVEKAEEQSGPITYLVNCAGTSICSPFEDTPSTDFSAMMNINYFGSINMTQAVLPLMKQRKRGHIVFTSSLAGLIGLYGYTAYSASKFAIFGAAQALQMEVKPHNIDVTVSFPPDTDTPGFAEEIKNKPLETMKISESGGLFSAQEVAEKTLKDAMAKKFMSSVGFEGWMLCTLCSGATCVCSLLDLFIQVVCMGLFRIAIAVYHKQCDRTIVKCQKEKQ